MSGASEISVTSFHKCTSENFLWELMIMQKICRKMVIIALFIKVKTFKHFLVENFNIHKSRIGK